ncbi:M23 family metallopeptidase [Bacillus sp. FJAT-47783]|uniref:murein hydrolase activator EnvC family protein n=1 Tax=Bacillus sp. FJAT-47783 TaxID=2922712 RepID=UPI001FAC5613|nr:M23 family metallopeptidase [Bacillus sp. FJAT-47783]
MKKKLISLSLAAVLGTSAALIPFSNKVIAESFDEKKAKIENERSSVKSTIDTKKNEIEQLEQKQAELDAEIKNLDMKVTETATNIKQKEDSIAKTKEKIEELKKQIAEVQARIEERNNLLKERAKSLQESGGAISYLDVILGAQSFSDFVTRISAVTTLVDADKKIIEEHKRDMKLLEDSKAQLNQELTDLSEALKELETLKKQLDAQIDQKNELLKNVETEHNHAMEELHELEDQEAFLADQARIIEQQKREYEQRKIEEQKKAAQQQQNSKPSSSKSPSSSSGSSGSSSPSNSSGSSSPSVNVGGFIWPAAGSVTSGYGSRWGKLHAGIDIAKRGTVPVHAAAEGTVIRSYYSSSYGNVVFISHNIKGKVYTTVYAHLSSRGVSSGQKVSQGQFIGYMGNTGQSYGQHLHFEVHAGPWNGSKSNSINPMSVLP